MTEGASLCLMIRMAASEPVGSTLYTPCDRSHMHSRSTALRQGPGESAASVCSAFSQETALDSESPLKCLNESSSSTELAAVLLLRSC